MCTEGSPLYSVTHWKPKWDILLSRHSKENINVIKEYLFSL